MVASGKSLLCWLLMMGFPCHKCIVIKVWKEMGNFEFGIGFRIYHGRYIRQSHYYTENGTYTNLIREMSCGYR